VASTPAATPASASAIPPAVPWATCLDKGKKVMTLPPKPANATPVVAACPSKILLPVVATALWSQVSSQGVDGGKYTLVS